MSCSPFDLRDYFFGELAREEQRAVDKHVTSCPACREELEELRLTQASLLTLREEEPPRRIAFVSDKVFEPRWWQRVWRSGPQLGFASAAMLAVAVLGHGFLAASRTVPEPIAVVQRAPQAGQFTQAEVARIVQGAVTKAVADSEARQEVKLQQAIAKEREALQLENRATLARVDDYMEYMQKQWNVSLHAANNMAPPGEVQ